MKQPYKRDNLSDAVSPVVGVMLMLVVVIIIAAVVSAFAGGLATGQKKAPTMTMEIRLVNEGTCGTSVLFWQVLSVSEPIPTKDVKIVTSWKAKDGTIGGATVLPWSAETGGYNAHRHTNTAGVMRYWQVPFGYGPNINWSPYAFTSAGTVNPDMMYGNYTFVPGVSFEYWPGVWNTTATGACGYGAVTSYVYTEGTCYIETEDVDEFQTILGKKWEHLRAGDVVNFKFIYIPTGGTILDKEVTVSSVYHR